MSTEVSDSVGVLDFHRVDFILDRGCGQVDGRVVSLSAFT